MAVAQPHPLTGRSGAALLSREATTLRSLSGTPVK
jgi:hypothetical protein